MNDADLTRLLTESKTIAVVGLSDKPGRPAMASPDSCRRRSFASYPSIQVRPKFWAKNATPRVEDIPDEIDIVDIFRQLRVCSRRRERRAGQTPALYLDARRCGA